MNCAWQAYINLLPLRIRNDVDKLGRKTLQELRLRLNLPPELITANGTIWLDGKTTRDDLSFCINAASRYSPWNAHTSTQGYITAPGGHRLGICGRVTMGHDGIKSIVEPTSICIRVARDIPGIAEKASGISGSLSYQIPQKCSFSTSWTAYDQNRSANARCFFSDTWNIPRYADTD